MNENNMYDLIIIGGGPAGLSAALYMARARYRTLLIEKEHFGGQISYTNEIVNYPGISSMSGTELTHTMLSQAESFGAEIKMEKVEQLTLSDKIKEVRTNKGVYKALTLILAMGASPRDLGFEGESEYKGRGIAYCATCDGEFFTGKDIFVVGGGVSAVEEAMFLTRYAKKVRMIVRKDKLSCPQYLIDQLETFSPKIDVIYNHEVEALVGDSLPHTLVYRHVSTKERQVYENKEDTFGVFVFSGYQPSTDLVKNQLDLDEQGYILTTDNLSTKVRGVFAAGDIRQKNLRQVITACADGALAATEAEKVAFSLHESLGLSPFIMPNTKVKGKHASLTDKEPETSPQASTEVKQQSSSNKVFVDESMLPQLETVFSRIDKELSFDAYVNASKLSQELEIFVRELSEVYHTLTFKVHKIKDDEEAYIGVSFKEESDKWNILPYRFYGIPGGHEFTSFILALYHQLGPKKDLDMGIKESINQITKPLHLDVVISLTCTKCPALLNTITQIMAHTPNLSLAVYDLNHTPRLKEKYRIMSVPCLIANDKVDFGLKDQHALVSWLLSTLK